MLPFAEWGPDAPDLGDTAREASGVIPEAKGYRPFKSLATTTSALNARAQGAAWFRAPDGTTANFAGNATKLYKLSSSTWSDVTRTVGGAYSTDAAGNWRFAQFGSLAYATNGVDVLQSFDLVAGTNWIAAIGSPPVSDFIAPVRRFLVLAKIASYPQRVQWSGDNNPGTWTTSASTLSDHQDLPDGGAITGFVGGDVGLVFQESAVSRMNFAGSPLAFGFEKISQDVGATIPNSVAGWRNTAIFCHRSGFHMVQGAQTITPIGKDRVDRWFWGLLDQSNMHRVTSAFDPVNGLYMISFPTGSSGVPAEILIYSLSGNRWAHVSVTCEMIYSGAVQLSWTLEDLNTFGTIEAVPFSLDSSYWTGNRQLLLSGFYTDHKSGTFSGANAAVTIDTQEMQPTPGRRSRILAARPMIDGGSPQIAVGTRNTQQGNVVWGSARSTVTDGKVPLRAEGRYARFRLTQEAGATWQWAQGLDDIVALPAGMR